MEQQLPPSTNGSVDDRGAAFKDAAIELIDGANREQLDWLIEYLWCCRRMSVLAWFNRHFFQMEVKERE